MLFARKYYPVLITIVLAAFSLSIRNPKNTYERPINADMKAYYAYLPAVFIYQDLSYNFIEGYEDKYYPEDRSHFKDFRVKSSSGHDVNKTLPGVAILLLPFFLLAHALTYLTGGDPDGYSLLYQWSILIATWTYLCVGLYSCRSFLLRKGFSEKLVAIAICSVLLGSSLYYYASLDFSVAHVFNFALISVFLNYLSRWKELNQKCTILLAALFALIVVIRPTNLLVVFLIPLCFDTLDSFKQWINTNINWRHLLSGLIGGLLITLVPIILWKAQTGQWLVYSYGKEGFVFSEFNWHHFIWSYQKGWLTYAPMLILSLIGLGFYTKRNRFSGSSTIVFLILITYFYSSWWMWTFGGGFGSRVMIDYSLIYMFGIVYLFAQFNRLKRQISIALSITLCALCLVQGYQTYAGILPGGRVNSEIYWENFLSLDKKARYYLHDVDVKKIKEYSTDFENNKYVLNEWSVNSKEAFSGSRSGYISSGAEYGAGLKNSIELVEGENIFRVSAHVKAKTIGNAVLVVSLEKDTELIHYQAFDLTPYLSSKWEETQFGVAVTSASRKDVKLKVYLWCFEKNSSIRIDNIKIEQYVPLGQ